MADRFKKRRPGWKRQYGVRNIEGNYSPSYKLHPHPIMPLFHPAVEDNLIA
jgi:hypothetical protein